MKALLSLLRWGVVRAALNVLATGTIAALLAALIYWTQFDVMWIAFLGGVLVAGGIAVATQASKAQWLAARRGKQLDRLREQLRQEAARSRSATEATRIADIRMRLLADALPNMILFVDREERCTYHNRAVEDRTGRNATQISGQFLRDVLGSTYSSVAPHLPETYKGNAASYEFAWTGTALAETYAAKHIPYPPDASPPRGFFLLLTPLGSRAAPKAAPSPVQAPVSVAVAGEGGEMLYLHSLVDQLMGWDEPRAKLEYALRENQFLLFAQKILPVRKDLADQRSLEILLRLREEEDNLLPPGGFLPVAEQYGMMEQLDRWVVRNLIAWCGERKAREPGWTLPLFCVNLSEAAVCSADFVRYVNYEMREHGFNARSLCFEIGEPEIIAHHADVQRFINSLKSLGCRFTVDAFGSVKVSFTHLKGLAVDFIKIDGVIIQNILRNPAALAQARAICTVCRKVGLATIAEFVESDETLARLREIGIDYAQGFGIARPEPLAKIPG